MVQGKSNATVYVSASPPTGTTISKIEATANGTTKTSTGGTVSINLGVLISTSPVSVSASATDARGTETTRRQTYSVLAYSAPTVITFNSARCDSSGNNKKDGTYVKVTAKATVKSLNGKNYITQAKISYRETTSSAWKQGATLNTGGTEVSQTVILSGTFDVLTSYELQISVSDRISTSTLESGIGTKQVLIDLLYDGTG